MEQYFCPIHNLKIKVYSQLEEENFTDNNQEEVAIFYNKQGKKYLKRFINNKCDDNCETIINILSEE